MWAFNREAPHRGARRGGKLPPETIVGEKWFYFPDLYQMTKVREGGIENGKGQISIGIFICKFQDFLNKFQSALIFSPNAQNFAARFLNLF